MHKRCALHPRAGRRRGTGATRRQARVSSLSPMGTRWPNWHRTSRPISASVGQGRQQRFGQRFGQRSGAGLRLALSHRGHGLAPSRLWGEGTHEQTSVPRDAPTSALPQRGRESIGQCSQEGVNRGTPADPGRRLLGRGCTVFVGAGLPGNRGGQRASPHANNRQQAGSCRGHIRRAVHLVIIGWVGICISQDFRQWHPMSRPIAVDSAVKMKNFPALVVPVIAIKSDCFFTRDALHDG